MEDPNYYHCYYLGNIDDNLAPMWRCKSCGYNVSGENLWKHFNPLYGTACRMNASYGVAEEIHFKDCKCYKCLNPKEDISDISIKIICKFCNLELNEHYRNHFNQDDQCKGRLNDS